MRIIWTAALLASSLATVGISAPPMPLAASSQASATPLESDRVMIVGESEYPVESPTIRFTVDQIRCRAAAESGSGKLLDAEIRVLRSQKQDRDTPPGCEPECILRYLAAYRRGQDAAAAMVIAFKIVSLDQREAKLGEFEQRLSEWRTAVDRIAGIGATRPDDSALQAQEDALPDAAVRLAGGRAKLRLQLASMLNLSVECADQIEIVEPLDVQPGEVDVVGGTNEALCHRKDLMAIKRLCNCITEDNLDTVRKLMGVLQPGIGLASVTPKGFLARCGLRHDDSVAREVALRKRQCAELAATRERQIRTEVASAAVHLEESYERLRAAQQLVETTAKRITQRRTLNDVDMSSGSQVIRAELEAFAAEDALIQRKADAREAEILWCAVLDRLIEDCP